MLPSKAMLGQGFTNSIARWSFPSSDNSLLPFACRIGMKWAPSKGWRPLVPYLEAWDSSESVVSFIMCLSLEICYRAFSL